MIWIDNTKIVAMLAVIFIHSASMVVQNSSIGSEYWWIGNIYDSFFRWAVPVFLMVSGALLLDVNKKEEIGTFYRKRLARILVPIIFWSIFFSVWNIIYLTKNTNYNSLLFILNNIIKGEPYYHMWFFYMLTMLYVFTPFLRKIITNSSKIEMLIFTILGFLIVELVVIHAVLLKIYAVAFIEKPTLFVIKFLYYIPFFCFGYLIRSNECNLAKSVLWGIFILSSLLTALGYYWLSVYSGSNVGEYFRGGLCITVVPMAISVMCLFKAWTQPIINDKFTKLLASLSLGVYLIHPIIMSIIVNLWFSPLKFNPLISIPAFAMIILIASLVVSWAIQQVPYLRRVI